MGRGLMVVGGGGDDGSMVGDCGLMGMGCGSNDLMVMILVPVGCGLHSHGSWVTVRCF